MEIKEDNILNDLYNMYKKDKYSLDIVQLRAVLDYKLLELENEKKENCDFASEWVHKSKIRELREELQKDIDSIDNFDTQVYGEYAICRYVQSFLDRLLGRED